MKKQIFLFLLFLSLFIHVYSQDDEGFMVPAQVIDGDTVPMLTYDEITISPANYGDIVKNTTKFNKLVRDVKKVYPYAVIASVKLKEYNDMILQTTNEVEKKKKLKQAEEDIKNQFTKDIENMTLSQGKILLKLIYRQTGVSSYEIVKELRGSLRAIFWQTIARFFGANLKIEYDPNGADKAIEEIVQKIENGTL
ncbi:MAG TPA: DUF4294 domain-containing protein [Bacteroidales bacterium]|nr:DUF4294 domain-containing protein [Bacteroidales bacterium]HQH19004.1 DUF4294 domain-containing protein [Bacteroidales bacterium]HQI45610.1 DUF4294 domain-containing protein [Bacteroidales bacterium]